MTFLRAASIGFVLTACGSVEQTSNVEQEIPMPGGCDEWGCGSNSPVVDIYGMHDIHGKLPWDGGRANAAGLFVTHLEWHNPACGGCGPTKIRRVWSDRAMLWAEDYGGTIYGGSNIRGLHIFMNDSSGANKYEIRVEQVGRVAYWAHVTGGEMGRSYLLEWDVQAVPGQKREWQNVCSNPAGDGSPDLLGMNAFHSIVFENDNIDAALKTVDVRKEEGWFNIGCAGHALAKLHLTGHTAGAAAQHGFITATEERQATLKMITADYCGTGYAFTVAGQELAWMDSPGYNQYPSGLISKKESEWTRDGASCLNNPRILANPPAVNPWPLLLDDIEAECLAAGKKAPPKCANDDPYDLNAHHMISSNPT